MFSAAEAALGALYLNAKEAVYLQQILDEMGHPQPKTPIQTNNTTAEGVINNKTQPKCTKAMDMQFHWLHDRKAQGKLKYIGNQVAQTSRITLQSIIRQHIMLMSEQNFSQESKTCQKPDTQKMKDRPKSQGTKLLCYKGVLDKLAYEN
jgi:hypothetical protein